MANKIFYALTAISFSVLAAVLFLVFTPKKSDNQSNKVDNSEVVKTEGENQVINITAKGGYYPNTISAKANAKTILRVKTDNTFDCSSALYIPDLKYSKVLPQSGITDIEIPSQQKGKILKGTCSMGMYRFNINFN